MSCACEHKRLGSELERVRKLAKAYARMQGETVVLYLNGDGTYNFTLASAEIDKPIVEYISQY